MQRQVVLLASSTESNISAWDLQTGTALTQYKGNASPKGGLCLLGRDYLVASQTSKHAIHFWTWHKDQVLQRSFIVEAVAAVAASPDGAYLAAGGASGTLYVWEVASGRLLRSWPAHYKAITTLLFLGGSGVLVSGGEDTLVHVWLMADLLDISLDQSSIQYMRPTPLYAWAEHTLPVTALAAGAGEASALVLTASMDRSIKLHRMADGRLLRTLTLPVGITSLALDAGEQALYAGGSDGNVYELNLLGDGTGGAAAAGTTGSSTANGIGGSVPTLLDAVARLEGHSKSITCLGLSPDGETLVSGSEDGTARVWDLRSRQPVQVLSAPGKVPLSGLLVLPQPLYLVPGSSAGDGAAAGGSSGSGRVGPKRPQPLAPLVKYLGMTGSLKPWEGPPVVLDGSVEFEAIARTSGLCSTSTTSTFAALSAGAAPPGLPSLVTGAGAAAGHLGRPLLPLPMPGGSAAVDSGNAQGEARQGNNGDGGDVEMVDREELTQAQQTIEQLRAELAQAKAEAEALRQQQQQQQQQGQQEGQQQQGQQEEAEEAQEPEQQQQQRAGTRGKSPAKPKAVQEKALQQQPARGKRKK